MRGPGARGPTVAFFDAECRPCSAFARVVGLLDVHHRLRLVPAQSQEAQRHFPLDELRQSLHVVPPVGPPLTRGDAMVAVLGAIPGLGVLPWAQARSRRFRRFANRFYGWVSRNRPRLGRIT